MDKMIGAESFRNDQGRSCWAMILAGGSGKRLDQDEAKAFVTVAGRPLLAWSLLSFARHEAITDIMVVVPKAIRSDFNRLVLDPLKPDLDGLSVRIHEPAIGGQRRQDSARAGLLKIISVSKVEKIEEVPVLIHDAARPIVPSRVIDALLSKLQASHASPPAVTAVIPALPVADTLKRVNIEKSAGDRLDKVERTISRAGLYQIQTPQAFRLGSILEAHQEAKRTNFEATDDAQLFERMNWPVEIVPGSRLSTKVTYPDDLAFIEGWLSRNAHVFENTENQ